jgi:ionotropic glutamate receptor
MTSITLAQSDAALMFDAISVYANGLSSLDRGHKLKLANLSCDLEQPWNDGLSLYNYLDSASVDGLTGKIEFNEGKRVNFKLDLLKLKREDLQKVGEWTSGRGLEIKDPNAFYETNITKITVSSLRPFPTEMRLLCVAPPPFIRPSTRCERKSNSERM